MTQELPELEPQPPRYVVGIDLGTTNSAMAFVDTERESWSVDVFRIPQLDAAGETEARETLPSFHYQPAAGEFATSEPFVGAFARDHGAEVPGRLIASAKSWLCHTGVDRTAELLPWHGAADVERLSPVEVSSRYLAHLRSAWDQAHPQHPLAEQDVVLTLPASFDEVARELTISAAAKAGLPRVVLIEEPQSAFYAWVYLHAGDWEQHVSPGQKILVCDIGGGTSDFTLIRVRRGDDGKVQFHRVAVGEHLILGGDNLDLALAHHLEKQLVAGSSRLQPVHEPETMPDAASRLKPAATSGGKLSPRQFDVLVRRCQMLKETLLGASAPEKASVSIPGSGAKLVGGALKTEITRDEVRHLLLDGFFPQVALDEKPLARTSGFQEFGLPYAADAAVTRYLAAFLTAHRHVSLCEGEAPAEPETGTSVMARREPRPPKEPRPPINDPARPDIVLFNGGLFESTDIRQRLIEIIRGWFSSSSLRPDPPSFNPDPTGRAESPTTSNTPPALPVGSRLNEWAPLVLENDELHLAVARGAAYYGMVRRGEGVKISAELARTYYVGVESDPPQAVCLLPARAELGQDIELKLLAFELLVDQPVEFPLLVSSTRLTDEPGQLIAVDREQMKPLAPIRTVLQVKTRRERGSVKVHLHARLTEIGTLQLWCAELEGNRRWRLEFDVRSATQTDVAQHGGAGETHGVVDEEASDAAQQVIASVFGANASLQPTDLMKRLAEAIHLNRSDWPPSLLRRMWEALIEVEPGRRRSQNHEARWLNLLGFALRPGYGLALDDWRVAETWRVLYGKLAHATPMARTEWWILWRRIAGGFSTGQQRALANPLLAPIRGLHKRMTTGRGQGDLQFGPQESIEVWRLLGALELLPVSTKLELGGIVLDLVGKKKMQPVRAALAWTLGRLGTRMPLYGPLNVVVPVDAASAWLSRLMDQPDGDANDVLAVMQMARRTDDRYRDIEEPLRARVLDWLEHHSAAEHYRELVRTGGRLDEEEQGKIFGDALPKGLRLSS